VKLLKIQGTTATVAVKKGIPTGFLTPGFWPTRTRYENHRVNIGAGRQQMENLTSALEYKGCPPKDMGVAPSSPDLSVVINVLDSIRDMSTGVPCIVAVVQARRALS
jgi:hypothetical protein